MPEDAGEKTEQPTARKKQEAREKGQVARSQDLSTSIILLATFFVLYLYGPAMWSEFESGFRFCLMNLHGANVTRGSILAYLGPLMFFLFKLILPIFTVLFTVSLLTNILQVGLVISAEPLTPNLGKLNPISGLKRIFSLRGVMKVLASIFKLTVISVVLWWTIKDQMKIVLALQFQGIGQIIYFTVMVVFNMGVKISIALVILAILDYSYQWWQHEKDLRMTKQEVRDELKRMEGDPRIKARRRQIAYQLAMQRMMAAVPEADVVVTNPTHFAVALKYEYKDMAAPVVTAKGVDYIAIKIKSLAKEHNVPIYEDKILARELYYRVEIDHPIPVDLFEAVAEILAFIYETKGITVEPDMVPTS